MINQIDPITLGLDLGPDPHWCGYPLLHHFEESNEVSYMRSMHELTILKTFMTIVNKDLDK